MKGKKKNKQFVSQFIQECISQNYLDTQQIKHQAEQQIKEIDQQLIEMAKLKTLRADLLDVVDHFGTEHRSLLPEEIKLSNLYRTSFPSFCNHILMDIDNNINTLSLLKQSFSNHEKLFLSLKEMLSVKLIIEKDGVYYVS